MKNAILPNASVKKWWYIDTTSVVSILIECHSMLYIRMLWKLINILNFTCNSELLNTMLLPYNANHSWWKSFTDGWGTSNSMENLRSMVHFSRIFKNAVMSVYNFTRSDLQQVHATVHGSCWPVRYYKLYVWISYLSGTMVTHYWWTTESKQRVSFTFRICYNGSRNQFAVNHQIFYEVKES